MTIKNQNYQGFEQGPIRPPSEANSLLIRITRNCPWNQCTFCPVYKNTRFSLRPTEHVIQDIDLIHEQVKRLKEGSKKQKMLSQIHIQETVRKTKSDSMPALHAAINWLNAGMESVFLQDANSLIIKPDDLVDILSHLRKRFPEVKRITSYARSHTISRISEEKLKKIADAGLNRIHIGLESGSDAVLEMVKKGATKAGHIEAGKRVKKVGIELSEYVMPGLGGVGLSRENAIETADALNQINPDFIRIRSLAIPTHIPLFREYQSGQFKKCSDLMVAEEILLFLETLNGITSTIKSDHILNLFQTVEGRYPKDKKKMTGIIRSFIELPEPERLYCQVGLRTGMIQKPEDITIPGKRDAIRATCTAHGITPETVDQVIDTIMRQFI